MKSLQGNLNHFKFNFYSEQAIATVRASVMVYEDSTKKWLASGSTGQPGISKVQVFQHVQQGSFRVVGRKLQDHEVVINCAIARGLKYNQATPTFHQWRDQRQVYGLNFVSTDDAQMFANAMLVAIEAVNDSSLSSCTNGHSSAQTQATTPQAQQIGGMQRGNSSC